MPTFYILNLWLHILGFALWLGGMAFFLIVFGPAVHDLQPRSGIRTLNQGRLSFESLSWAAIGLLLITGIVNLIARSQMPGMQFGQTYVIVLSIKLFLFVAMLVHHSLQVFKYGPRIAALTSPAGGDAWPEPLLSHWRKWFMLLKINATLGPITLLLGLNLRN